MDQNLDANVKQAEEELSKLEGTMQSLLDLRTFLSSIPNRDWVDILMALRCGSDGTKNSMPPCIGKPRNDIDHEAWMKLQSLQVSLAEAKHKLAEALYEQHRGGK